MSGSVHPSDEELWADEPSARRHVAGCTTCQEAQASARLRQQAVTDVLAAATPVVTRMPTTVAHRLAAALDAATLDAATLDAATLDPATLDPVILDAPAKTAVAGPGRRTSVLAGLAAAAAVLVLAAVIGIGQTSDPVADGGGGEQTAGSAAEAGQTPADAGLSGAADSDEASAPPPIPPALLDVAQRTDAQRTDAQRTDAESSAVTTCGARLLDDPGDAVVAVDEVTTDRRGGVLVTVDDGAGQVLWWLPSCTAGPGEAWGRSPLL